MKIGWIFAALAGSLFSSSLKPGRDPLEIERTDVRTISVAEIDDTILAGEIAPADRLAVLVCQGERAADRGPDEIALLGSGILDLRRPAMAGREQQQGKQGPGGFVHDTASHALLSARWQPICRSGKGKGEARVTQPDGSMKFASFARLAAILALAVSLPQGAQAQFSDTYKFIEAVRKSDAAAVTKAIEVPGVTPINTKDRSTGETALHIALGRRDSTWTSYFLAHGARTDILDNMGRSPLMVAVERRYVEGVEMLLARKANPNQANDSGETPLIRAVQLNDIESVRLLLGAARTPIARTASRACRPSTMPSATIGLARCSICSIPRPRRRRPRASRARSSSPIHRCCISVADRLICGRGSARTFARRQGGDARASCGAGTRA